jgi:hypothetical protein
MLRRRLLIMLGVVLIVVLALGGYKAFSVSAVHGAEAADQCRGRRGR